MLALTRYGQVKAETGTPRQQMAALFEAAQGQMRAGIAELEAGRLLPGGNALLQAARIVHGLRSVLKPSVAPELCRHLGIVYGFVCIRLNRAVEKRDIAQAREAAEVFAPVAAAFIELSQRAEVWT
jgi:flagellin-specific chaperone FliS